MITVGSALAWLAWNRLVRNPLAAGLAAYDQRAWDKVEAEASRLLKDRPGDPDALRLLARAKGRQGRDAEAQAIYRQRLGFESMTAEDFVVAASGLRRQRQLDQARIALEKAQKREPDHPEMLHELASLDLATGHLADGAELAGRLVSSPGWDVKALLLLCKFREQLEDRAGMIEAVESALQLSPSLEGAGFSVSTAKKRLARALLQTGRPAEAHRYLEAVLATGRDAEASWLLSRALLQRGDIPGATVALAQSEGYGDLDPTRPDPSPYAGAAQCAMCHRKEYETQQASRHSRTFHPTTQLADLPPLDGQVIDSSDAKVRHSLRRGERFEWETTDDGRILRAVVQYAFGSGNVAITLVGEDSSGDARELRLSHYGRGAGWDVTSGHWPQPQDRREFLGRPLGRDGIRRCLECHTTNARVAQQAVGPAAADRGIGCERCHGPAANHGQAVAGRFLDLAVARPRLASAEQIMVLCAACHRPKEFKLAPGDHLAPRFAAPSLAWSRCYTESGGALSCVSCHNPHRNAETSASYYEARCVTCHPRTPQAPSPSERSHERTALLVLSDTMPLTPCPVNPTRDCLVCHMPKIDGIVPHASFTDHHIRVHRRESVNR
jgi:tetratricopeptide (TPR) repeat protein